MRDITIRRIYVCYFLAITIGAMSGCGGGGAAPPPNAFRASLCGDVLYPDQTTSPHVLPYYAGEAYPVGQGNCVAATREGRGGRRDLRGDIAIAIG